jgi:dTDP-4-dehydrorhamnose 3,5-epimerase
MKFTEIELKGAFIIDLEPFSDNRGEFMRLFCKNELQAIEDIDCVQANYSINKKKGTLRGMHFQNPPFSETKIIKCLNGSIYDVIVDLRKGSPTYLKWHAEVLKKGDYKMLYIPKGFGHGFQTLEDDSEVLYFHSEFYNKAADNGFNYEDSKIRIKWPLPISVISEKDKNLKNFDFLMGLEI